MGPKLPRGKLVLAESVAASSNNSAAPVHPPPLPMPAPAASAEREGEAAAEELARKASRLPPPPSAPSTSRPTPLGLHNFLSSPRFPPELVFLVFDCLTGWEAACAACVCRAWRAWIAADERGWRRRFAARFADARDVLSAGAAFSSDWASRREGLLLLYVDAMDEHAALGRPPQVLTLAGFALERELLAHVRRLASGQRPAELVALTAHQPLPARARDVSAFRPLESWAGAAVLYRLSAPAGRAPGSAASAAELRRLFDAVSKGMADLLKPYVLHCGGARAPAAPARAPDAPAERRLLLPAPPESWARLFSAAAAAALRSRCVVCGRCVGPTERHRVLRAPLCEAEPACQAAYPVLSLERAAAQLGAIPGGKGPPGEARVRTRAALRRRAPPAEAAAEAGAAAAALRTVAGFCVERQRHRYRRKRENGYEDFDRPSVSRMVLQSTVDSVARVALWGRPAAGPEAAGEELERLRIGE